MLAYLPHIRNPLANFGKDSHPKFIPGFHDDSQAWTMHSRLGLCIHGHVTSFWSFQLPTVCLTQGQKDAEWYTERGKGTAQARHRQTWLSGWLMSI